MANRPRGRGYRWYLGFCEDCDERCKLPFTSKNGHGMWARRHADKTGHTAAVQSMAIRNYKPKEDDV